MPTKAWKRRTQGEPWSTGDDYNLGIGQGFMTATPLQVTQMAAVVANGGFLYRPTIIHHMTDENGNVVFVDDKSEVIARAHPGPGGVAIVEDANGNPLDDPALNVEFDANGEYIFQPEVIDALDVDRRYIEIVSEGMQLVNQRIDEERFYTGATYVDWLDEFGVTTAGKTGTSEYCDNIAIKRGWCRFEKKAVQPTHAWYVGYASVEDPEIVVGVFVFNGGEGSAWAAPVACNVIAAYYGLGQYAEGLTAVEWEQSLLPDNRVCNSKIYNPVVEPESFAPEPVEELIDTPLPQPTVTPAEELVTIEDQ